MCSALLAPCLSFPGCGIEPAIPISCRAGVEPPRHPHQSQGQCPPAVPVQSSLPSWWVDPEDFGLCQMDPVPTPVFGNQVPEPLPHPAGSYYPAAARAQGSGGFQRDWRQLLVRGTCRRVISPSPRGSDVTKGTWHIGGRSKASSRCLLGSCQDLEQSCPLPAQSHLSALGGSHWGPRHGKRHL